MTIRLESKRSGEVRDHLHDWSLFLVDDTIASQTTTAVGATINSSTIQAGAKSIRFWVAGGTDGGTAIITQTIVSTGGRSETETFSMQISAGEPVSLDEAKAMLRIFHFEEDAKIAAMITRARRWVEEYSGFALIRRQFVERSLPNRGAILVTKSPLISVSNVSYTQGGVTSTIVPRIWPPNNFVWPPAGQVWPGLIDREEFSVTYVAGFEEGQVDDQLLGAMMALIEGEYSEGYAYPERATQAAERCCGMMRPMFQ